MLIEDGFNEQTGLHEEYLRGLDEEGIARYLVEEQKRYDVMKRKAIEKPWNAPVSWAPQSEERKEQVWDQRAGSG